MACALIAAVLLSAQEAPQKQVYSDPKLGLSLEMPADWTMRKERVGTTIEIPLANNGKATAQIYNAVFRQTAEEWQSVQKEVSEAMGRTVENQWQEEFLGVPMLFTRLRYAEEGARVSTLVGLLYSRTPEKFQFRMTAPVEQAPEAEQKWRDALLTLRTISGQLPEGEDPSQPVIAPQPKKNTIVLKPADAGKGDGYVGPVRARVGEASDPYDIFLPEGWQLASDGTLTHPSLRGRIMLTARGGTAIEALRALTADASGSLKEYDQVRLRKDAAPKYNRAGAEVATVWRYGTKDGAPLNVLHAIGFNDLAFWLLTYRSVDDATLKADTELVNDLLAKLLARRGS
ncbi:MAG: hypothetical protein KIT11_11665 [Fimbriimonadaceae bacterium]|nr:hypothetical protein [Fimbriimonadaceae bacterium]QYK55309.1 MAG: hypothetical protein KF733_09870 [Fimbriimonadaceae bacterium]